MCLEAVVEGKASHAGQTALQDIAATQRLGLVKALVDIFDGCAVRGLINLGGGQGNNIAANEVGVLMIVCGSNQWCLYESYTQRYTSINLSQRLKL